MNYFKKFLCIFNNFFVIPLVLLLAYKYLYEYCNTICFFEGISYNILISILIVDSIYLILLGATGKSNVSNFIMVGLLNLLFVVNQVKIIYVDEPLFFSDFNFIRNTASLINIVGESFWSKILVASKYFIILFIVSIIVLIYQFFFKLKIKSLKVRSACVGLGVFLIFILFFPFSWSKNVYKDLFFNIDGYGDYYSYTSYVSLYSYYGIIGGMYYNLLDNRLDIPEDYDDKELENILDNVSNVENNIGSPNIIVVLSESFFDVGLLKDNIVFDKDITFNFNSLKKDGYLLENITPSYGGMTANVAFEVLTGGNMSYFGRGYIPFMQLYDEDKVNNSIVRELANNGYYTEILMGNDSYNSEKLMLSLGFKKYTKIKKNEMNVKGDWVSDDHIADLIIDNMNKIEGKKFIMVETMQSHMDYRPDKYRKYDISVDKSNLEDDYNEVLLSYAQGIYDADLMLKRLYDYIQTIDEETVLIFFGDHLPYLKNIDGINIIDKLDYFNTDDELVNLYRLYNTESLILSNYNMELNLNKNDYLGFDLLLSSLISQMDIEVNSYYKWLYSTKDILPSYNRYVMVDKSGNIYDAINLEKNMKDIYELRNLMMYKKFVRG